MNIQQAFISKSIHETIKYAQAAVKPVSRKKTLWRSKLTPDQVEEIRCSSLPYNKLNKTYKISNGTISAIRKGEWHVQT